MRSRQKQRDPRRRLDFLSLTAGEDEGQAEGTSQGQGAQGEPTTGGVDGEGDTPAIE